VTTPAAHAPVRWGICGTGAIAEQFVRSLEAVPDARVVAVGSTSGERAEDFGRRLGIERRHATHEALARDDSVDVVYVASTHEQHRADTILFLEAGRHVLCEKPMALSVAEATRMIDAAQAGDRFLMEAMWSRFLPSYVELGRLLDQGAIGRPLLVTADFSFAVPEDARADHRLFDPARGGGALLDLGVYPLQLSRLVFGAPDEVFATGLLTDSGVDGQTTLTLTHAGGGVSMLSTAIITPGTCTARIMGTDGSITLDAFMHATQRLTVEGAHPQVIDTEPASLHYQVPEVHRCLREGRQQSDGWSWADTLATLTVTDQARRQIGVRYPSEEFSG
jgi:predicted dehydrogenase